MPPIAHAALPLQPASEDIWDKKYRLKDKAGNAIDRTVEDTFRRVARAIANAEATPELREHWFGRFLWAMQKGAIPAGRITSNAGGQEHKPATSLINCTVSGTIQDNMDDIMRKAHEAALTLKAGCVARGTLVQTEKGFVPAEVAVEERHKKILAYDRSTGCFVWRRVLNHMKVVVPRHENIRIHSGYGTLTTSVKHPILVWRNNCALYVRADEVRQTDALIHQSLSWSASQKEARTAWFVGAHLGDGSAHRFKKEYKSSKRGQAWLNKARNLGERFVFKIRAAEREVVERYAEFFQMFAGSNALVASSATPTGTPVWDYAVNSFEASKAVKLIDGQTGKKCDSLYVPRWIKENPQSFFLPFLAGLIDTDGTVSKERGAVSISAKNGEFVNELQGLLGLFGVHGAIVQTKASSHQWNGVVIASTGGHVLKISDSNFLAQVEPFMADSGKKGRILAFASSSGQYDQFVMTDELKTALLGKFEDLSHEERTHFGFYHGYHRHDSISRIWLSRWAQRFPELGPIVEKVKMLRPVKAIEHGVDVSEDFYDFTVEHDNNYLAGNGCQMVIHNCGIGYSFSTLRPRGAFVLGAGSYTSGPLSFMDIYDKTCFTVASAGGRRGAQMGTFDVGHPDVREFVRAKREAGRLRQFNLSLLITDEFIKAVEADALWTLSFPVHPKEVDEVNLDDPDQVVWREWETTDRYITRQDGLVACKVYQKIKARHLWDAIMTSTYDFAEPGFILIDRVNEMNNNWWCENIRATNPCVTGDTPILTRKGEVAIRDAVGREVEVWNGFEFSRVVPRVTGVNQKVVQLTFSTGGTLTCTLYHGFFRGDGQKVEARDLRVGDALMPFRLPGDDEHRQVSITAIDHREGLEAEVFCFNEPLRHAGVFAGVLTANCGEQPLPPHGSCLLGSINLTTFVRDPFTPHARFDWDEYREVVRVFTRLLDNVVELNGLPLPQQIHEITHKRRHGMGFLGLGSALTMLQMPYGSDASVAFTDQVSRELALVGWEEALALAQEKGPAPIMDVEFEVTGDMLRKRPEMATDGIRVGDKLPGRVLHAKYSRYMQRIGAVRPDLVARLVEVGARFTHHSSIAPTGTISLSLGNNVSNGIEPSFAHSYSRNIIREGRKAKEKVDVFSYELLAYRAWVNPNALAFTDDPALKLPAYFTVADQVSPKQHVDIQAASQKWIDSSISKTANVPTDYPYEDFKGIYLYAYHQGLKGCTTFRFNPEAFQGVLVKEEDLANTTYRFTLEDGTTVEVKGNEEVTYDGETNSAANLFDALKEGYYGKF